MVDGLAASNICKPAGLASASAGRDTVGGSASFSMTLATLRAAMSREPREMEPSLCWATADRLVLAEHASQPVRSVGGGGCGREQTAHNLTTAATRANANTILRISQVVHILLAVSIHARIHFCRWFEPVQTDWPGSIDCPANRRATAQHQAQYLVATNSMKTVWKLSSS